MKKKKKSFKNKMNKLVFKRLLLNYAWKFECPYGGCFNITHFHFDFIFLYFLLNSNFLTFKNHFSYSNTCNIYVSQI